MNDDEARASVGMLLAAYPRESTNQETVGIWSRMIRDLDFGEVREAILRIIATRYTFPTIADLRGEVMEARLALPAAQAAYESWLARAHRPEEASNVHPFVREFAQSSGFDAWTMRQADNPSVLRGQFLKAYEERRRAHVRGENLTSLGEGGGYAAKRVAAGTMAALGGAEGGGLGRASGDDRDSTLPPEGVGEER